MQELPNRPATMCGIFALVQPPQKSVDVRDIKRACSLMQHRGPDQSGYALLNNGTVGFGHNRLSIQDPTAPPQPLVDHKTGTTIIFNGEVYDHIEIGLLLKEQHGIMLADSTDTAVILALYILHGPTTEFFSRLNGEFAFVIWDAQRQILIAARDRFGVKPLFWYYDSSKLIFASEIKAILSVDSVERKFSTEWLDSTSLLFMNLPTVTFAEGVFAVCPGKYLTMDFSGNQWETPKYNTYWSAMPLLCTPNTSITYKEAKAEVRKLLIASVKRRLVADREVCVYLSGSVDSTIICGIISSLGHPLTSVTMGFGDHPLSEEDATVKTAQYYSLQHERVNFTSDDAAKFAKRTIYHTETPIVNPHSVAKFCLSKFARDKNFVVSLTGEGADELFLGNSLFSLDILLAMRNRGGPHVVKVEKATAEFSKEAKRTVLMLGILPKDIPRVPAWTPGCWHAEHVRRLRIAADALRASEPYQDRHWLPTRSVNLYTPLEADGLSGVRLCQFWCIDKLQQYIIPSLDDRLEMANSTEGRTPLLDQKFADFVLRLPNEYLVDPDTLQEKKILYDAFEDMLPPHTFNASQAKQPFPAPSWCDALFNTEAGQELRDKYLSREALGRAGLWLPERVENMIAEVQNGAAQLDHFLGFVLSVQVMHDLFIVNPCVGDPDYVMVDKTPRATA